MLFPVLAALLCASCLLGWKAERSTVRAPAPEDVLGGLPSEQPLKIDPSSSLNVGVLAFHRCKQVQKQLSKAENPLICDTLTSMCLLLMLSDVLNSHGLHVYCFSENICKAVSRRDRLSVHSSLLSASR